MFYKLFLGTYAKFREEAVSFVMFVYSVCPHGTTRYPLEIFSWNFTFYYFSKIIQSNFH